MSGPSPTATYEVRDADEARHLLLQSFLLQRLQPPQAANLQTALAQAIDLAGSGVPLPPLGVLADLENLLLKPHASSLNRAAPGTASSKSSVVSRVSTIRTCRPCCSSMRASAASTSHAVGSSLRSTTV